jgi:hypothetical protein
MIPANVTPVALPRGILKVFSRGCFSGSTGSSIVLKNIIVKMTFKVLYCEEIGSL